MVFRDFGGNDHQLRPFTVGRGCNIFWRKVDSRRELSCRRGTGETRRANCGLSLFLRSSLREKVMPVRANRGYRMLGVNGC